MTNSAGVKLYATALEIVKFYVTHYGKRPMPKCPKPEIFICEYNAMDRLGSRVK